MHTPALDFPDSQFDIQHPTTQQDNTLHGPNMLEPESRASPASGRFSRQLRVKPQTVVNDQRHSANWRRQELLSLLSTSGTLAGLCITVVALMNTFDRSRAAVTIVDDMFGVCALAFLSCIYLIFWAIRSRKFSIIEMLIKAVEGIFLMAMTFMTVTAFLMMYTI